MTRITITEIPARPEWTHWLEQHALWIVVALCALMVVEAARAWGAPQNRSGKWN